MENISHTTPRVAKKTVQKVKNKRWSFALSLLFYPVGIFRIWRSNIRLWLKLVYSLFGLPIFVVGFCYLAIVLFALFLPALDRTVGDRKDRTIINKDGNYSATFLKTARETNNAYELVQVELEPMGGNDWHYHNSFTEQFTVLEGSVNIGNEGKVISLKTGQTTVANKEKMHYFKNALKQRSILLVKTTPASGLEKTLRVAYGLIDDGLLKNDMTKNPWHMCLLLAYSESYLPVLPSWFQEPLINGLAKIAQWKGEDRDLYKYFK